MLRGKKITFFTRFAPFLLLIAKIFSTPNNIWVNPVQKGGRSRSLTSSSGCETRTEIFFPLSVGCIRCLNLFQFELFPPRSRCPRPGSVSVGSYFPWILSSNWLYLALEVQPFGFHPFVRFSQERYSIPDL